MIIVHVVGGVLVDVISDEPLQYILVDGDDLGTGEKFDPDPMDAIEVGDVVKYARELADEYQGDFNSAVRYDPKQEEHEL